MNVLITPTEDHQDVADFLKAVEMAAKALEGFERVGDVLVSPPLAVLLKPYQSCPRGSFGIPGKEREQSESEFALMLMGMARQYVAVGPDETFVCIPKMWYEECVKVLSEIEGSGDEVSQR